jgi:hypothetical protein
MERWIASAGIIQIAGVLTLGHAMLNLLFGFKTTTQFDHLIGDGRVEVNLLM